MLKVIVDDSGLKRYIKRLEELADEKRVALHDLLNQQFIRKYTEFNSLEEMLQSCPLTANAVTAEEFKVIQESDEWNAYIQQHTRFKNWQDMLNTAVVEWLRRKLSD